MVPIMLQVLLTLLRACLKELVVIILVKVIRDCFMSSLLLKASIFVIINMMIIIMCNISVENVDKCLQNMGKQPAVMILKLSTWLMHILF